MKQKHFIDLNKGITFLVVFVLIAYYQRWDNVTAWIYLALHGTYGVLWVMKSRIFPDRQWEQVTGWPYGLVIFFGLALYWLAGWLVVSRDVHAPAWMLAACVSGYSMGVFLHFSADMQKYTALRLQPNSLITDGFFFRLRNPNYLGELLIYSSFSALALHWLPWVNLLAWVLMIWLPNMRRKDRSLARYAGFSAYQERTDLIIPFIY